MAGAKVASDKIFLLHLFCYISSDNSGNQGNIFLFPKYMYECEE